MMREKVAQVIIIAAFACTVLATGIKAPLGVMTISTCALVIGAGLIAYLRHEEGLPIFAPELLNTPVVIASLVYFALGLSTVIVVEDQNMFFKEVVQRAMIILLPLYVCSMATNKPTVLKNALMTYTVLGAIMALWAVLDGAARHFVTPANLLGMHKNHVAGSCSVLGSIAVAGLLTTAHRKKKLFFLACLVLGVLGCVASQGRAGLLCILLASLLMMVTVKVKTKYIVCVVVATVVGAFGVFKLLPDEAKEHIVTTKKYSANEIRTSLWTEALPLLASKPFIAVGWGQNLVVEDRFFGDLACVLLFDWMQMTVVGALTLLTIIFSGIWLPFQNARSIPPKSMLSFINLSAMGIVAGRFTHGMLDTFWIGRGVTLTTWAAIGMAVFVKIYLLKTKGPKSSSRRTKGLKTQVQKVSV